MRPTDTCDAQRTRGRYQNTAAPGELFLLLITAAGPSLFFFSPHLPAMLMGETVSPSFPNGQRRQLVEWHEMMISLNEVIISLNEVIISLNEVVISLNEAIISLNEVEISFRRF